MPALWGTTRPRTSTVTRAVVHFLIASVVALVIVVIAAAVISSRVAKDESETAAGRTTQAVADALQQYLTPELLSGDPNALKALNEAVRTRVAGTEIVRFKLWAADGTIVYADQPSLIGERYACGCLDQHGGWRGPLLGTGAGAGKRRRHDRRDQRKYN